MCVYVSQKMTQQLSLAPSWPKLTRVHVPVTPVTGNCNHSRWNWILDMRFSLLEAAELIIHRTSSRLVCVFKWETSKGFNLMRFISNKPEAEHNPCFTHTHVSRQTHTHPRLTFDITSN